jgi:hypothetical protein
MYQAVKINIFLLYRVYKKMNKLIWNRFPHSKHFNAYVNAVYQKTSDKNNTNTDVT